MPAGPCSQPRHTDPTGGLCLFFGGYGFLPGLPYPSPDAHRNLPVLHLFKCFENLGLGLTEYLIQVPFQFRETSCSDIIQNAIRVIAKLLPRGRG